MAHSDAQEPSPASSAFLNALADHYGRILRERPDQEKRQQTKFMFCVQGGEMGWRLITLWLVVHGLEWKSWDWRKNAVSFLWSYSNIGKVLQEMQPCAPKVTSKPHLFFFAFFDFLSFEGNWERCFCIDNLNYLLKPIIQKLLSIPDTNAELTGPLPVHNLMSFLLKRSSKGAPEGAHRVYCSPRSVIDAESSRPILYDLPFLTPEDRKLRGYETRLWFPKNEFMGLKEIGILVVKVHAYRITFRNINWSLEAADVSELEKHTLSATSDKACLTILETLQIRPSQDLKKRVDHVFVLCALGHEGTLKCPQNMKQWVTEAHPHLTSTNLRVSSITEPRATPSKPSPRLDAVKAFVKQRTPWSHTPRSNSPVFEPTGSIRTITPDISRAPTPVQNAVLSDISNRRDSASSISGSVKSAFYGAQQKGSLPSVPRGQGLGIQGYNVTSTSNADLTMPMAAPHGAPPSVAGNNDETLGSGARLTNRFSIGSSSAQPHPLYAQAVPSTGSTSTIPSINPQVDSRRQATCPGCVGVIAGIASLRDLVKKCAALILVTDKALENLETSPFNPKSINEIAANVLVSASNLNLPAAGPDVSVSRLSKIANGTQQAVTGPYSGDRKRKASRDPRVRSTPNLKLASEEFQPRTAQSPLLSRPAKQQRVSEEPGTEIPAEVAGPIAGPSTNVGAANRPMGSSQRPRAVDWLRSENRSEGMSFAHCS